MHIFNLILLVLGLICFVISTFTGGGWGRAINNEPAPRGRVLNLVALGLAFWILVPLIAEFKVVTG